MKKDKLIRTVAAKLNKHNIEIKATIDTIFDTIISTLKKNENVDIVGFGSFEVRNRKEKKGRNPKTGVPVVIPPGKNVVFRPGKHIKEAVRNTTKK
jgi:DNA-binding protein HU-beta